MEATASDVALIVVDMQEYFCRDDSAFSRGFAALLPREAEWYQEQVRTRVIPTIAFLIDRARAAGSLVVFTEFGSREADGSDLPIWARRHNEVVGARAGSPVYPPLSAPESRVVRELQPIECDLVVQKNTSGPLAGTDLPELLRQRGIARVIATGVATNVCVLGMARELADSNFDVCVVSDACTTLGEATQRATINAAIRVFASVASSDELEGWLPL
jgi:nicotinamidase-related amidase